MKFMLILAALVLGSTAAHAASDGCKVPYKPETYVSAGWAHGELNEADKANVLAWTKQNAGPKLIEYLESVRTTRTWVVVYNRAGQLGNSPPSHGWFGVLKPDDNRCFEWITTPIYTGTVIQILKGDW